jgi:hypothetical protein
MIQRLCRIRCGKAFAFPVGPLAEPAARLSLAAVTEMAIGKAEPYRTECGKPQVRSCLFFMADLAEVSQLLHTRSATSEAIQPSEVLMQFHLRKAIQLAYWDRGRPARNERDARKSSV